MTEATAQTDVGFGLTVVFAFLSVLGAVVAYAGHADQLVAGAGFGVAVLAGGLAITATHLYER